MTEDEWVLNGADNSKIACIGGRRLEHVDGFHEVGNQANRCEKRLLS